MEEDGGVGDEQETEGHGNGLVLAILDWRVWFIAIALTSQVVALSFNAFFPTLTATLGYDRTVTLLLCAPPWGFAAIVAFVVSRSAHKIRSKLTFNPHAMAMISGTLTRYRNVSIISSDRSWSA